MAPRTYPQKRSEMVGICRGDDLGPDMPSFPCGMPRRLPLCHTPLGANVPSSRAPGLRRLRGGAPSAYGLHLDGLVVYLMLPLFALCAYAVVGAASLDHPKPFSPGSEAKALTTSSRLKLQVQA